MARYQCENCNELRDQEVCPKCGALTHVLPEDALDKLVSDVARKAAAAEAVKPIAVHATPTAAPRRESAAPARIAAPARAVVVPSAPSHESTSHESTSHARPQPARPEPVHAAAPEPAAARPVPPPEPSPAPAPATTIVGLDEFHGLLDRGREAVIICGNAQSGKSEIAYGYVRANNVYQGKSENLMLRAALSKEGSLGSTISGEVWFQPIDKKHVFLDPSGEFFQLLSRRYRQELGLRDIGETDFRFVQRAAKKLAGVILVVDLTSVVDPRQQYPWRGQETDLSFVLSALRWLRWDETARPDALSVTTNIADRVAKLPRIDKRVLVLFSKADQLTKYTNQSPLEFARHRLPTLHAALMTHAHRFRYDYCHTMLKGDAGRDEAVDPCGVLLPINWVLHDPFHWLPLQLPTSVIGGGK
jgi:hypothetical protein